MYKKNFLNIIKDHITLNILWTFLEERLFITLREPCQNASGTALHGMKVWITFHPSSAIIH